MKTRRAQAPLLVLGLLWAAWQSGCNFEGDDIQTNTANRCSVDDDCSGTSICEAGMCVETKSPSLEVGLEVRLKPNAADGNPLTMTLAPFQVNGPTQREVRLPQPVQIAGDVRYQGERIAADIRFTPQVGIEGLAPTSLNAQTRAEPAVDVEGGDASYLTQVLTGISYRMRIVPTGDHASKLPPLERTVRVEEAQALHREDVDYDDALSEVEKLRIEIAGVPSNRALQARVLGAKSGRVVSSSHVVETSPATLSMLLMPFEGERILQLVPASPRLAEENGEASDWSPYPTFTLPLSALEGTDDEVHRIALPEVPEPVTFRGIVELCSQAGQSFDEGLGLPVTFRSSSLQLDMPVEMQASFSATTMTGTAAGKSQDVFEATLLPGEYEVVVAPPSDSRCGIYAEAGRRIESGERLIQGELFTLQNAAMLTGKVLRDGSPMPDVRIQAMTLARAALDEVQTVVARYNRSSQDTTNNLDDCQDATEDDCLGRFELPLDVGRYDILVKPPSESGFGWKLLYDVGIGTKRKEFGRNIPLDSPVPLTGRLRTDEPSDAKRTVTPNGAEITAYVVLTGREDESPRAVAVGTAVADEMGRFTLLLSPTLRSGLY